MSLLTSLISYYKLDEASGDATDSNGSNTLTDNNSVGTSTGKINGARSFVRTSSKYLAHTDNASLSFGDEDFTVAGWANRSSSGNTLVVIGKWQSAGNQLSFVLGYDTANTKFFWIVSRDGTNFTSVYANSFGGTSTSTWYYLVAWHDSVNNVIGISVNDTSDTSAYSLGVFDSTADFRIGADQNGAYWDGLIDEVGVWRRVLTSTERTSLYNSGNGLAYPFGVGGPFPHYIRRANSMSGCMIPMGL